MMRLRALSFALAVLACGLVLATPGASAAGPASAAKKKHCKKTQVLRKGRCVPKPKPPGSGPTPQGPDPLSDADGDGLPYKWETTTAAPSPKCTSKQRLLNGRCVPKCKKGQRLKRGKCVKVKKNAGRRRDATARASLAEPASVAPLGADPNHKDIFVQIDYASEALRQNVAGACGQLDALVAAFANAPVTNPDGKTGINLHIDAGVKCPSRSYDLGGSKVFDAGACPGVGPTMLATEPPESRIGTFHVAGFSPSCGSSGGENGVANLLGTKMVIFTEGAVFAHVLMHELGHNLGLDHPFGYQPNRFSSMNTVLFKSANGSTPTETLDYQRFSVPALDENHLSEEAGISAPPEAHEYFVLHYCEGPSPSFPYAWPADGAIDWNCNTPPFGLPVIDPGILSLDVNGDGQKTVLPATSNEWLALQYSSGGQIGPR